MSGESQMANRTAELSSLAVRTNDLISGCLSLYYEWFVRLSKETSMRRVLFMLTALVVGCSGKDATAPAPVAPRVASLTIEPPGALEVGMAVKLTVTLRDAASNILYNRRVTFTSSNESVAKVDQSGLVTALADGYAIITATSEGRQGGLGLRVDAVPLKCSPERRNVCAADETFALISVRDQPLPVHSPWGMGDWDYDDDAGTWQLIKWSMTFYPEGGFFSEMIHRGASGATRVVRNAGTYVRSTDSILFSVQGSRYLMAIAGDTLTTKPGEGRKFMFVREVNQTTQ